MGSLFSVFRGSFTNEAPRCSHHTNMIESLITAATELAMEEAKSTRHKRERRKRRQREKEMEQQQPYLEEPEFQPARPHTYPSMPGISHPWYPQPHERPQGEGRPRQYPSDGEGRAFEPGGGSLREDGSANVRRENARDRRGGMPRQNRARDL